MQITLCYKNRRLCNTSGVVCIGCNTKVKCPGDGMKISELLKEKRDVQNISDFIINYHPAIK